MDDSLRLADWTTFRIGGPADRIVVARTDDEVIATAREADSAGTPLLVVSGGSNMLVADEGFRGTALVITTTGVTVNCTDTVDLCVAAGEPWDDLVKRAVNEGWSGLEMLSGIPGLVGAAPVQNIGAYGAEVASVVRRVRAYDRATGQITTLEPADCRFGYRRSLFKQATGRYIVLSVDLRLRLFEQSAPIEYAELARHLSVEVGGTAPITEVRRAVLELRRGKGMVLDESDHDTWSAGSFFTNPVITADAAAALPESAPRFPQPDGSIKTSAAWLIDHAGFDKGYGTGPARLSSKHVLALTNRGDATAQDIITLARAIRERVRTTYGISLDPEPLLVDLTL